MNNLHKREEKLLWKTTSSIGLDQETLTLSEAYSNFDEIVFCTTPNDITTEWRVLTSNIVIGKTYIAYGYGNLTYKFTSSSKVWFDGSHQWLNNVRGIKY